MNTADRKPLPGTSLAYFDARAAVERIAAGAYAERGHHATGYEYEFSPLTVVRHWSPP